MDNAGGNGNGLAKQTGASSLDRYRREALKVGSLLLSYPELPIEETWHEIRAWSRELAPASHNFQTAIETLLSVDINWLAQVYVETFDFNPRTSLSLTAHEFGDSRQRGTALIKLLRILAKGGFLPDQGELADAIPVLLEYLAEKPDEVDTKDLEMRLAALCAHLTENLGEGHVYYKVFVAIGEVLPQVSQEQIDNLRQAATSSDSEEDMPYPVFYHRETADGFNVGPVSEGTFEQLRRASET